MTPPKIKCPKCSSDQLTANKKGFSGEKAVAGAILTGGIGILAGTIGSNKIKITCLSCGHEFEPGNDMRAANKKRHQQKQAMSSPGFWLFLAGLIFVIYLLAKVIF